MVLSSMTCSFTTINTHTQFEFDRNEWNWMRNDLHNARLTEVQTSSFIGIATPAHESAHDVDWHFWPWQVDTTNYTYARVDIRSTLFDSVHCWTHTFANVIKLVGASAQCTVYCVGPSHWRHLITRFCVNFLNQSFDWSSLLQRNENGQYCMHQLVWRWTTTTTTSTTTSIKTNCNWKLFVLRIFSSFAVNSSMAFGCLLDGLRV